MFPNSLIEQTGQRFKERTSERQEIEAKLSTGSAITANAPDRVEKRIARIVATEGLREAAARTEPVVEAPATVSVLERILGKNDLMSVTFLESAVAAAKTVTRIRVGSGQKTLGYGTGSLVAPNGAMTNNQVDSSAAEAAASLAQFNYQDGIQTPTVFGLDHESFFVTDPTLDYTIVAVRERGTGATEVKSFGFNRLIEQPGKILIGKCLNIQHPEWRAEAGRPPRESAEGYPPAVPALPHGYSARFAGAMNRYGATNV